MRWLGRVWSLPLWVHMAMLAVVVVALAPFMELNGGAWVDDEGLYGLQVEALGDGGWEYEYGGEAFDPEHRWFPIQRGTRGADGFHPYVKHPAYPAVVAATTRVSGPGAGVFVLSMLGLVAAATAAWLLAGEIEPRASRVAFWLVAVSPQAVNAYTLWAHTLSAALAGFALWAGVRIVRYGLRPWSGLGVVAALGCGVLLRTEAILFAAALPLGFAGALVWRRRLREALFMTLLPAAVTAGALVFERWWVGRIVGKAFDLPGLQAETAGRSLPEIIEGRLGAAWLVVFDGGWVADRLEHLVVAALVVTLIAGLALRLRGREGQFLGAVLAVTGAVAVLFLYGVRFAEAPDFFAPGFFAAWPVALFGLAACPWRAVTFAERTLLAVGAIFAAAVFASQYDTGAATEWGGRFLSPLVVPVAVLAAVGLLRRLAERRWNQQLAVTIAVVALAVFPASRGIEMIREIRTPATDLREVLGEVVVIDNPDLQRIPLGLWRLHDRADWFVSFGQTPDLLAALAEAGVEEVTVLTDPTREAVRISSYARADNVTTPELEARGIPVIVVSGPTVESASRGSSR